MLERVSKNTVLTKTEIKKQRLRNINSEPLFVSSEKI
jgi:hypothetical protein